MDQSNFEVQNETSVEVSETPSKKLNCKALIVSLSVIALVLQIVYGISLFIYYGIGDVEYIISLFNRGLTFFELIFDISVWVGASVVQICSYSLSILSIVLFLIYILILYPKRKAGFFLPIIFGIPLLEVLISNMAYRETHIYFAEESASNSVFEVMEILLLVLFIAVEVVLFIGSVKKKHKAKIMGISLIVLFVMTVLELLFMIPNTFQLIMDFNVNHMLDNINTMSYILFQLISTFLAPIAALTLYFSQLLFVSKNDISSVTKMRVIEINPEKEKEKIKNMAPEKALKALKKNFERGVFTEEEYNAQREEVMQRLYK